MAAHQHCRCCLSRRSCLRLLSAGALTAALPRSARAALAADLRPGDPIGLGDLRPRPDVRVQAAIFRQPPPYWLGWPGTTYDLPGHQREYPGQLEASAKRLALTATVHDPPVQDGPGLDAFLARLKETRPHGALVILQHLGCWGWVERVAKESGVPLIVFAPVGTAFTQHVNRVSHSPGVYVVSSLSWAAVETGLRMIRAKRLFEATRLLWIRGTERSETVLDRLGTKVRAIPRATFNELFARMPATTEAQDTAADLRRRALQVVEPTDEDTVNCARAYLTAKHLLATEQAHGLSMDCLGMVGQKLVPTPPCGAWTLLQDAGLTAGCEADLHGATSLMLASYLLDRPGFMNDPVPDTGTNELIAAHCTAGTRLWGFDRPPASFILRNHSESALGVSVQVLHPVGEPATLLRFTSPHELLVDTGRITGNVDTPPAGGCRTSVRLLMDDVEDCRDVRGFHQVVVLGDHRRTLEAFGQLYGIKVTHSPRQAAE